VALDDLLAAQSYVTACESCFADAQLSFDYVLDAMTGCDPTATEYLLQKPAMCPRCGSQIAPKTRIVAN